MAKCNKIKHKTEIAALKHIRNMKEKKGGKYAVYYCAGCNAYHITSKTEGGKGFLKYADK